MQVEGHLSELSAGPATEASNASTEDAGRGVGPNSEQWPGQRGGVTSASAAAGAAAAGGIEIDPALLDDAALFDMME